MRPPGSEGKRHSSTHRGRAFRVGLLGVAAALLATMLAVAAAYGGSSLRRGSAGTAAAQAGCAGQISIDNPSAKLKILPANCYYQSIPDATCGPGSRPETGFQGEVPLALRTAGFKGFSCNLKLVGQWQGQGASWQNTWYGHCAYYDQALPPTKPVAGEAKFRHPGSVVVDVTDPAHPKATDWLATGGLIHPWESLKVNDKRGLLAGQVSAGAPLDVYSVAKNCARPKLLSSVPLANFGHEGDWSPDGKTYWAESIGATGEYHPVDMSEPTHPKEIMTWPGIGHRTHGLSISNDGKTGYFSITGNFFGPNGAKTQNLADDGFVIADVSDVQLRKPNPKIRVISTVTFLDGGIAQHTIPITIGGKPYLVFVDEVGGEGIGTPANWQKACKAGLPPFGIARIFDISNPKRPALVSRLTLQTDNPANCQTAVHDEIAGGQMVFAYDSHYCSVDRRTNATALACGYFNSGVRVFDIRNPAQPREIAYFNPRAQLHELNKLPGSEHAASEQSDFLTHKRHPNGLSADWCSSQSRFYHAPDGNWYLWATCQDNGFMALRFTNNAYPLH